jgi:hypothetical protein
MKFEMDIIIMIKEGNSIKDSPRKARIRMIQGLFMMILNCNVLEESKPKN